MVNKRQDGKASNINLSKLEAFWIVAFSAEWKHFQQDGNIFSKMEAFSARWNHFLQDESIFSKMEGFQQDRSIYSKMEAFSAR